MENKWHTCDRCDKTLSSYRSLWRHKQNCCSRGGAAAASAHPYIPTFNSGSAEFVGTAGKKQKKSKETMEKIERLVQGRALESVLSQREKNNSSAANPPPIHLPAAAKDPKRFSEILKPISFGELWCGEDWKKKKKKNNDDDDDDDDDEEEEEEEEKEKDRLKKRFNKLFCEFMRQEEDKEKLLENRNELVYLLDEMLSHGYISGTDLRALNNIILTTYCSISPRW